MELKTKLAEAKQCGKHSFPACNTRKVDRMRSNLKEINMNQNHFEQYISGSQAAGNSPIVESPITCASGRAENPRRKEDGHPASRPDGKNSEMISPLSTSGLPPDFDFIANMSSGEKIDHIKSILLRSEDEAVAEIAPALRLYGTAAHVVEAYLPLVVEVKKHFCRSGRPRINPATGERNRTWREICKNEFGITIRRMQQILADVTEPKPAGVASSKKPKPRVDRREFERARQVAAPAVSLAIAIVKDGLADKFPQALEILKAADVPVPEARPPAVPDCAGKEQKWKQVLILLLATLESFGEKLPIAVRTEMSGVMKMLKIRPEQLSRSQPVASAEKLYQVKKRADGHLVDFVVTRNGKRGHFGTFDTESEAQAVCESLNTSPVTSLTRGLDD